MGSKISAAARAMLVGVWVYRHLVSPLKPRCCRFTPTCSAYARLAFVRHGFFRGGWMSVKRILRCHPLYKGSLYDPVPPSPAQRGTDGAECERDETE